jgi:ATP:corrinoid adenosyltransferase
VENPLNMFGIRPILTQFLKKGKRGNNMPGTKPKQKVKPKTRERIYGFSWKTNGTRQAIYEQDCESRQAFMKERASFKRHHIRIKDYKTKAPYGQGGK